MHKSDHAFSIRESAYRHLLFSICNITILIMLISTNIAYMSGHRAVLWRPGSGYTVDTDKNLNLLSEHLGLVVGSHK